MAFGTGFLGALAATQATNGAFKSEGEALSRRVGPRKRRKRKRREERRARRSGGGGFAGTSGSIAGGL